MTWMSSTAIHLQSLEKKEQRILRLLESDVPQQPALEMPPLDSQQHHREVTALVFHKAQVQGVQDWQD